MKYSWLFYARGRLNLGQIPHLPIREQGPGDDDRHADLLRQQVQRFAIILKTTGADGRRGDLCFSRGKKLDDLIQVRQADGQNRPGVGDLPLSVGSIDDGGKLLQNGSGAALLQVFKLQTKSSALAGAALQAGVKKIPGIAIQISVFDLMQSQTVISVQKQIRIDEDRRVAQSFFQRQVVKPHGRSIAPCPLLLTEKPFGEKELDLMLADEPFRDPVGLELRRNGVDPVRPGGGTAMAVADDKDLQGVIGILLIDDRSECVRQSGAGGHDLPRRGLRPGGPAPQGEEDQQNQAEEKNGEGGPGAGHEKAKIGKIFR